MGGETMFSDGLSYLKKQPESELASFCEAKTVPPFQAALWAFYLLSNFGNTDPSPSDSNPLCE